jgi:hypothetical protein
MEKENSAEGLLIRVVRNEKGRLQCVLYDFIFI